MLQTIFQIINKMRLIRNESVIPKRISHRISENQSDEADSVVFILEEEVFNDININQDELQGVERLEAFLVCLLGCKLSFGQ